MTTRYFKTISFSFIFFFTWLPTYGQTPSENSSFHLADEELTVNNPAQEPSPITRSYLEMVTHQTHQQFHNFLTKSLTPLQQRLLLEYLYQELHNDLASDTAATNNDLQHEHHLDNTQLITKLVQLLYYYTTYIYTPLVEHADKQNLGISQDGLVLPSVIGMTQYVNQVFPNSQPFNSLILAAPIAYTLFSRHHSHDMGNTVALSSTAYGTTLALAAQASAGILNRYTTFDNFSAAILASAYRHLIYGHYTQAAIDSILTIIHLKHHRGWLYTALGAALANLIQIRTDNWTSTQFLQANDLLPFILAYNLTEDHLSFLITASTMLLNQHLFYRQRDLFLDTGHGVADIEPYWHGAFGIALMTTLTLALYWRDMPTPGQVANTLSGIKEKITHWLNYVLYVDLSEDRDSELTNGTYIQQSPD